MKKVIDKKIGFTIVELVVVITVIGILAVISVVSYSEVVKKAVVASLKSDLDNNADKLELYYTEHNGVYPSALDVNNCPSAPVADTTACLKLSSGTTLSYYGSNQTYSLKVTKNFITYRITDSTLPTLFESVSGPDWIVIGTQIWAKANLNVGTMVVADVEQTNNSILEKYCYDDVESECTTYGGLYQWDEAMQYVTKESAQGICPSGSHIPSDAEWKTLEMSLSGMSQATADMTGFRGTDEGTKLKTGGSSGLNFLLAGNRYTDWYYSGQSSYGFVWSSSALSVGSSDIWKRTVGSSEPNVLRATNNKGNGFSVRCVGD